VTIMKILHLVDMKHSCDHRGMREGYLLVWLWCLYLECLLFLCIWIIHVTTHAWEVVRTKLMVQIWCLICFCLWSYLRLYLYESFMWSHMH
jgi:hypothetical protein